ncbi:MAG TPA: DUF2798 domain-containing protein [Beijerinckiaceae bacterium]|nr:DUF2798 domain-containing protein [Beijerinckiaceae bacterium]
MKKIPARHTWLVMPAILALLMTFVVSCVSTLRAIGLAPDFASKWMQAWLLSYVVAYPTLLAVMPVVRRLVAAIVEPPKA